MSKHAIPDVWDKAQRVLRTAFTTTLTVLPLIPQVVAIVNDQIDAEWLIAVGTQAVIYNTILTRVIAIPVINSWLTSIGLGALPKREAEALSA